MQIEIKIATVQDIEKICEVLNQALNKKLEHKDEAWDIEPFLPSEIQSSITNKVRYNAWQNGVVIGTFILLWQDEKFWGKQPDDAAYIHQLAVGDGYRGQGIGRAIFNWVNEAAKLKGKKFLRIDISLDNDALKKYYEQLGFELVKSRPIISTDKSYTALLYERHIR